MPLFPTTRQRRYLSVFLSTFMAFSAPPGCRKKVSYTELPAESAASGLNPSIPADGKVDAQNLRVIIDEVSNYRAGSHYGTRMVVVPSAGPDYYKFFICSKSNPGNCSPTQSTPGQFVTPDGYFEAPPAGKVLVNIQACVRENRAADPRALCGPITTAEHNQKASGDEPLKSLLGTRRSLTDKAMEECGRNYQGYLSFYRKVKDHNVFSTAMLANLKNRVDLGQDLFCTMLLNGQLKQAELDLLVTQLTDDKQKAAVAEKLKQGWSTTSVAMMVLAESVGIIGAAKAAYAYDQLEEIRAARALDELQLPKHLSLVGGPGEVVVPKLPGDIKKTVPEPSGNKTITSSKTQPAIDFERNFIDTKTELQNFYDAYRNPERFASDMSKSAQAGVTLREAMDIKSNTSLYKTQKGKKNATDLFNKGYEFLNEARAQWVVNLYGTTIEMKKELDDSRLSNPKTVKGIAEKQQQLEIALQKLKIEKANLASGQAEFTSKIELLDRKQVELDILNAAIDTKNKEFTDAKSRVATLQIELQKNSDLLETKEPQLQEAIKAKNDADEKLRQAGETLSFKEREFNRIKDEQQKTIDNLQSKTDELEKLKNIKTTTIGTSMEASTTQPKTADTNSTGTGTDDSTGTLTTKTSNHFVQTEEDITKEINTLTDEIQTLKTRNDELTTNNNTTKIELTKAQKSQQDAAQQAKDAEITFKQNLGENKNEIDRISNELKVAQRKFDDLGIENKKLSEAADLLKRTNAELERKLTQSRSTLTQNQTRIKELEQVDKENKVKITNLQAELDKNTKAIQDKTAEIDASVKNLALKNEDTLMLIEELKAANIETKNSREAAVSLKNENTNLKIKFSELTSNTATNTAQSSQEIAILKEKIAGKDREISKLYEGLTQKNETIRQKEILIELKSTNILELTTTLYQQEFTRQSLHQQITNLQDKINSDEIEKQILNEKNRLLSQTTSNQRDELETYKREIALAKKDLEISQRDLSKSESEKESSDLRATNLETTFNKLQQAKNLLDVEIATLTANASSKDKQNAKLESQLENTKLDYVVRIKEIQSTLDTSNEAERTLRDKITQLTKELGQHEGNIPELNRSLEDLKKALAEAKSNNDNLSQSTSTSEKRVAALEEIEKSLRDKIASLEETNKKIEETSTKTLAEQKADHDARLKSATEGFNAHLAEIQTRLTTSDGSTAELKAHIASLQSDLGASKGSLADLKKIQAKAEEAAKKSNLTIKKLRSNIASQTTQLSAKTIDYERKVNALKLKQANKITQLKEQMLQQANLSAETLNAEKLKSEQFISSLKETNANHIADLRNSHERLISQQINSIENLTAEKNNLASLNTKERADFDSYRAEMDQRLQQADEHIRALDRALESDNLREISSTTSRTLPTLPDPTARTRPVKDTSGLEASLKSQMHTGAAIAVMAALQMATISSQSQNLVGNSDGNTAALIAQMNQLAEESKQLVARYDTATADLNDNIRTLVLKGDQQDIAARLTALGIM